MEETSSKKYNMSRGCLCHYIGMLPKFLALLIHLLRDPRVSSTDKSILAAAVAYVLNPVELVPDLVPFLGLTDDVYLVALAVLRLFLRTDEAVIREYWHVPGDLLHHVRKMANLAGAFLPSRIRQALFARMDT